MTNLDGWSVFDHNFERESTAETLIVRVWSPEVSLREAQWRL